MNRRLITLALLMPVLCASCKAQTRTAPTAPPPTPAVGSIAGHSGWPAPKAADVQSVDSILAALYDVISGPAGHSRDWNRMRSLFIPDARLIPARVIPAGTNGKASSTDAVIYTVEDYINRSGPNLTKNGFFEHSIHNEIQQFGNIVHIFSTYESRHSAADPAPFARGINSIQLLKDGSRYWIVNVFWDSERASSPIPAKFLPTP